MSFEARAVQSRGASGHAIITEGQLYVIYAAEQRTGSYSTNTMFLLWLPEWGGWVWMTSEAFVPRGEKD